MIATKTVSLNNHTRDRFVVVKPESRGVSLKRRRSKLFETGEKELGRKSVLHDLEVLSRDNGFED